MIKEDLQLIIKRLEALKENHAEGVSMQEIRKSMCCSAITTRKFIQEAMAAGLCVYAGTKKITTISGMKMAIPAYKFKMTKKRKTKKEKQA